MSISGIHGHVLEITVVGCSKLKNTEWISKQDPYVCLEYASTKHRTRTCTDGGKNPTFQEKFVLSLIEGLREVHCVVWNSNTLSADNFIGSGKIQLQKVLSDGYDDSSWVLQDKRGRNAGEVRLIMHYANAKKPAKNHAASAPSAPPHAATQPPQIQIYPTPPPVAPYPSTSHPPPSPCSPYPPNPATYPPPPYQVSAYPYPLSNGYPPNPVYPPNGYPPNPAYPPNNGYPPPPWDSFHYPHPGSYPQSPYHHRPPY